MESSVQVLFGQTLRFTGDPFLEGLNAVQHDPAGAVVIENGRISWVGPADQANAPTGAIKRHFGDKLIMAGFVDAHLHYPQTAMIASWGKRLIEWLNSYTFPEEMRFGDPAYAATVASRYFELAIGHGTTSMCSYATIHPESVDAFFAEAQRRGVRAYAGKTAQTVWDMSSPPASPPHPRKSSSKRLVRCGAKCLIA